MPIIVDVSLLSKTIKTSFDMVNHLCASNHMSDKSIDRTEKTTTTTTMTIVHLRMLVQSNIILVFVVPFDALHKVVI